MRQLLLLLLTVATVSSGSARAETGLVAKPVADTKAVTLDPARSYIIVQTPGPIPMVFIRQSERADVDDYLQRRKAALVKAHARWVRRHTAWVDYVNLYKKYKKEPVEGLRYAPPENEPIEPTEANLTFRPIELENIISIGPINRFAKSDLRSTYITEVTPGTYSFYGSILIVPNQTSGVCMCMGTVKFEVKAGQIVHIGTIRPSLADAQAKAKAEGKPVPKDDFDLPDELSTIVWNVPVAGDSIDPRLAGYKIDPAKLIPGGRFANYYGLTIDRVSAIPGVFSYDRGKQLDLTTTP